MRTRPNPVDRAQLRSSPAKLLSTNPWSGPVGGKGTILGAILGTILLSLVSSSLALLNVSVYWQDIIRGSILLAAVTFDHYLVKRQAAGGRA